MLPFYGKKDSDIYYLQRSIDVATKLNYNRIVHQSQLSLSVVYSHFDMYDSALICLRQAYQNDTSNLFSPHHHLSFVKIFNLQNQQDSIAFYVNSLKNDLREIDTTNIEKIGLSASIYDFLAQYSLENKEYDSAFYYQQKSVVLYDRVHEIQMQENVRTETTSITVENIRWRVLLIIIEKSSSEEIRNINTLYLKQLIFGNNDFSLDATMEYTSIRHFLS